MSPSVPVDSCVQPANQVVSANLEHVTDSEQRRHGDGGEPAPETTVTNQAYPSAPGHVAPKGLYVAGCDQNGCQ
jgi:hypothetical protein